MRNFSGNLGPPFAHLAGWLTSNSAVLAHLGPPKAPGSKGQRERPNSLEERKNLEDPKAVPNESRPNQWGKSPEKVQRVKMSDTQPFPGNKKVPRAKKGLEGLQKKKG